MGGFLIARIWKSLMAYFVAFPSALTHQKGAPMNYTYILKCADNTLYTGWTTNLEKRLKSHNQGKGAKYTRPRLPVTLLYYEEFQTKKEAMRREAAIKKLSRPQKERLIASNPISSL